MVSTMTEKSARKPHNILIVLEALNRVRIEALRSKQTGGEWLEEAIEEQIKRTKEVK